jgi:serine/threonine protein kinase
VLFEESKEPAHDEKPSIYNFLPVALLGEGSYGQVYLVEDINSDK